MVAKNKFGKERPSKKGGKKAKAKPSLLGSGTASKAGKALKGRKKRLDRAVGKMS